MFDFEEKEEKGTKKCVRRSCLQIMQCSYYNMDGMWGCQYKRRDVHIKVLIII